MSRGVQPLKTYDRRCVVSELVPLKGKTNLESRRQNRILVPLGSSFQNIRREPCPFKKECNFVPRAFPFNGKSIFEYLLKARKFYRFLLLKVPHSIVHQLRDVFWPTKVNFERIPESRTLFCCRENAYVLNRITTEGARKIVKTTKHQCYDQSHYWLPKFG